MNRKLYDSNTGTSFKSSPKCTISKKKKVFAFIFPFLIRTKLSENPGKMVRFLEIFQYHLRRIIINDTPRDGIKTFRWIRTH